MRSIQRFCNVLLLLIACVGLQAQSYNKLWKQVEQAQKQSSPQTVIKLTDEIYQKGEREQNAPQMLKAYVFREAYQQEITPDSLYTSLKYLERWVQSEKNPVNKSILHSLLAHEYLSLMVQNQNRLLHTTVLDEAPSTDIREWSLKQFVEKVDEHSVASLQDSLPLLNTSAKEYVPFVILQEDSRFYQHDLYHLLATRAIATYQNLNIFRANSLVQTRIEGIYEKMIHTYGQRANSEDALVLCTLNYWNWKEADEIKVQRWDNRSTQKEQTKKDYLQALDRLITTYGSRQICAEVYISKALYLRKPELPPFAQLLQVCEEGLKRYPSYKRIDELKNIRQGVLQSSLVVQTSSSTYPGDSLTMDVNYRNLGGFTLNLYRTDLTEVPPMNYNIHRTFLEKHARKVSTRHFALKPLSKAGIPPEDMPYQRFDTTFVNELQVPHELGVYLMQLVPDAKDTPAVEQFLVSTRIKLLTLVLPDNKQEVMSFDARSGHPIPGVLVSFYSSDMNEERALLTEVTTDAHGKAIITWNQNIRSYSARKGTDTAMKLQYIYHGGFYERGDEHPQEEVTLLTDRSLYRPGQTIYLKGIAYKQAGDSAYVSQGRTYQVSLLDVNRTELSQKELRTNEFGSFATEFILPTVCLNGNFTIEVKGESTVSVRVEEYKRPTFDITFNPVKQAYVLGDTVQVTGNVKSYSGVTLQEMPLVYTIVRNNAWSGFRRDTAPLASDTIQLDAEGNFSIPVRLQPNAADQQTWGAYTFQIEATVTDDAGETQSASFRLNASQWPYSFQADIKPELCKEDSLAAMLRVENANGELMPVEGIYRLYPILNAETRQMGSNPVYEGKFTSGQLTDLSAWKQLPSARYGLVLSALGKEGKEVQDNNKPAASFFLFSLSDTRPAIFMDSFLYEQNTKFDATHPASFNFGTSFKDTYLLMDVFGKAKRLESRALTLSDSILHLKFPYREEYGKGVVICLTFVKNGQMYTRRVELEKRQPDHTLLLKWEVFRDRLRPGQEEQWKLIIKTPQGFPAAAEMLATMYDASLDKIYSRYQALRVYFNRYMVSSDWRDNGSALGMVFSPNFPMKSWPVPAWTQDHFYSLADAHLWGNSRVYQENGISGLSPQIRMRSTKAMGNAADLYTVQATSESLEDALFEQEVLPLAGSPLQPVPNLRTNFAETAFFYPQLRTNERGEVAFSFTMPQSLTRWNFRSYSHTKDMMTGMLDATVVTAKEFMLSPNMPRFVRVGDKTQIAATIANLTGKALKGITTFTLFDPVTEKVIATRQQNFAVGAGQTTSVNFPFHVTDRCDVLGVRIMADGGTFSDGEQHLLPVLSNKVYLTEALAMPIRGKETRTFALDSLFNHHSATATQPRLTVEFTGNPAWYAVQALPVLSQTETDNAIAWATAYYANTLAGYIANSQSRIKAIFDSWKLGSSTKETFLSQLQKNQEVKNILLSNSPWVMEATTEAEQQARIATLFDVNLLNSRNLVAFTKLKELQGADGTWRWYSGMSGSHYLTAYITELLVRLPQLTHAPLPADAATLVHNSLGYLYQSAMEEYRTLRKAEEGGDKQPILSDAALQYLYLVALDGQPVQEAHKAVHRYLLSLVPHLLENGSMSHKAQAAIVLLKAGRTTDAQAFIASLKQHLVQTDEQGAHFAFHDQPYAWGMMPVSVHVQVMEALRLAGGNEALLEEMKLWLLKQKQTNSWTSSVTTADAIYALLCQGSNLLAHDSDVRITLGRKPIQTLLSATDPVAGLGYIKQSFGPGTPQVKATSITVQKLDAGIAWGAVYAQYLSPIADVKQQGGELSVDKRLYVERVSPTGERSLQPIDLATELTVGDKVVSRLTLRLDRSMDFIQLKDQRGACFEPIGSLSGYRWHNGFGYYIEVEDAATNFFFDHLAKGVYVLEHSYRVARGGTYEAGVATLQSAYAPQYASHSAGAKVVVK